MSHQKDRNKHTPRGQKRVPVRNTRLSTIIGKLPQVRYIQVRYMTEDDEQFEELLDDIDYQQSLGDAND